MNLPNKLTLLRIILVPFFVLFLLVDAIPLSPVFALVVFIAASITDFFDGHYARKHNMVTDFGKFADPLADKILIISAFCCFIQTGLIGAVPVIIVLFREFAVTSVRLVAASKGKVVAANMWGKVKTVLQMLTIIFYYFVGALAGPTDVGFVSFVTIVLCWLCGAATLLSGGIYLWQNRDCFMRAK